MSDHPPNQPQNKHVTPMKRVKERECSKIGCPKDNERCEEQNVL